MAQSPPETRLPALAWPALALGALALAAAHARITVIAPDAARFTFDSAEYALAGRTWLETGRLATPFVHPAVLGLTSGPPYPLLAGHPLVPALDALAFALAGAKPDATLAPAMLAFVACVLLVARLALELAGSRAAALGAGAAFALSPWALGFACEGRSEMPFAALLTAAFVLLVELPQAARPFWLGAMLGLAQLARPVALPLLPGFGLGLWLLSPPGKRLERGALALAGFLPLASLTAIYKWASIGNPLADVGGYLLLTGITPEWTVSRLNRMTPPPDALVWIAGHPGALAAKLGRNARSLVYGAWDTAARWPAALAGLSSVFLLARGERRARAFAVTLIVVSAVLLLLAATTVADPRILFPLFPAGMAMAFAGVARLAESWAGARRLAVVLAVSLAALIGAIPLARAWRAAASGAFARPGFRDGEWRGLCAAIEPMLPRAALVASDAAPWIAWYTRRSVTLVPLVPDALAQWPERWRPKTVVLTNEWLVWQPREEPWRDAFRLHQPPAGYRFAGHARSGRLEAAVFDRANEP